MSYDPRSPEAMTEITPEMLAAGLYELKSRYQDLSWPVVEAYPDVVRAIYHAMEDVRQSKECMIPDHLKL